MGFKRVLLSGDGRIPQPMRAGDGLLANFVPTNFNAEADATLTVSQLAGGLIQQGLTLTSAVVYTLPTAALIAAAFPEMDIGDAYSIEVVNAQAAAFDTTLAVGVGITAIGTNNALSVAPKSSRIFTLVKTAAATFDLY